jgi:hypothetical protein
VAINFSDKTLVTNPTCYHLGRAVAFIGIMAIIIGIITYFTGDVILPSKAWPALGVPACVIGVIFVRCGLTKN